MNCGKNSHGKKNTKKLFDGKKTKHVGKETHGN